MEGEEVNGVVDDGLSDEEDADPVPRNWSNYNHSALQVNVGENIPWEYKENEVCVGALYQSRDEVKADIKRWFTLFLQHQFRVEKSSLKVYDVRCVRNDCPFRVHAYKGKWKDYWEVTRVVKHECLLAELE